MSWQNVFDSTKNLDRICLLKIFYLLIVGINRKRAKYLLTTISITKTHKLNSTERLSFKMRIKSF